MLNGFNIKNYMENKKVNVIFQILRIILFILAVVLLISQKNFNAWQQIILVSVLLILVALERFDILYIPGLVKLEKHTESIDKKMSDLIQNISQRQTMSVQTPVNIINVPQNTPATSSSSEQRPPSGS